MCQLSEDRNIRNIPSVTKGETHTNRLSFRLNKHKVSYFRLLHFYFSSGGALGAGGRRAWVEGTAWSAEELPTQRWVGRRRSTGTGNCWNGDANPARFPRMSYRYRKNPIPIKQLTRDEIQLPRMPVGEALGPSRNTTAAFQ